MPRSKMKSSVEEPKYSFNEVEHEGLPNGSKNSTVGYGHFAFFHARLMLTIATRFKMILLAWNAL